MKKDNPEFDVPMGAYDSAEVCELVVLFVLHKLRHLPVSVASVLPLNLIFNVP